MGSALAILGFCLLILSCFILAVKTLEARFGPEAVPVLELFEGLRIKSGILRIVIVAGFLTAVLTLIQLGAENKLGTNTLSLRWLFPFLVYVAALNLCLELSRHLQMQKWLRISLQCLAPVIVAFSWLVDPNWIAINAAAAVLVIFILSSSGILTIRSLVIVALGVMLYDIVAVFVTGTMQKVAFGVVQDTPLLFKVPSEFDLNSAILFKLGLGDVVLPGFIVMVAALEARRFGLRSLFTFTVIGYFIGLIITLAILFVTYLPQPATIYLIPSTFGAFLFAAWRKDMTRTIFFCDKLK